MPVSAPTGWTGVAPVRAKASSRSFSRLCPGMARTRSVVARSTSRVSSQNSGKPLAPSPAARVDLPAPLAPMRANQVWSYDFVFDACANGQQLKCLTLIDEFTKEALAIDVAGSIRSARVVEVLNRVISERGAPRYLRSDNGPEFVATALLKWATDNKIETALIDPGKPWQNGTTESFNGKFRDECLSVEWFRNRLEARVVIKDWMDHYNEVRPHSSLGYRTPREFVEQLAPKGKSGEAKVNMAMA